MKWIDRQADFDRMLERIRSEQLVAVDTEADSLHSYFDKVCLMQVSVPGEDFVVDPLASIDLSGLGRLLADRATTKVLHGADYDLRILNRDFGFAISNLVDTMVCSQLLGYEAFGLAALLKRHFGLELDKSHQRADWAMRPLPPRMLDYAATDTRHLIGLSTILREELQRVGRWEWALEEFSRLESIRFEAREEDREAFRKLKGSSSLERRGLAVLSRLHQWRDTLAQRSDRPAFKVASNELLVEVARLLPRSREALSKVKGVSTYHLNRYGGEILRMVEESMQLPEAELPEKSPPKPWVRDRRLEATVERLKKVRDQIAAELRIDPAMLAPKHVLSALATLEPGSIDDLNRIPAMREWQKRVVGIPLLEAMQSSIAFKR
jgi:ribonuclease D